MNKSANISTNSLAANPSLASFRPMLVILALLACLLPWIIAPGVSLTLNAYDLAEWTSLTPMARASAPMLLTSLLLRLPLSLTTLLLVIALQNHKWLRLTIVIAASIALLPPLEFITRASDDPNYRQQFAVAIFTLLAGIVLISLPLRRYPRWAVSLLSCATLITGIWGLSQAHSFMESFLLPVTIGPGLVMLAAALVLLVITEYLRQTKTRVSMS